LISPQDEGTVSDLSEAANLYQAGSLASSGFEVRASAPGAKGGAFSRQASAVHAQTNGSAGAASTEMLIQIKQASSNPLLPQLA